MPQCRPIRRGSGHSRSPSSVGFRRCFLRSFTIVPNFSWRVLGGLPVCVVQVAPQPVCLAVSLDEPTRIINVYAKLLPSEFILRTFPSSTKHSPWKAAMRSMLKFEIRGILGGLAETTPPESARASSGSDFAAFGRIPDAGLHGLIRAVPEVIPRKAAGRPACGRSAENCRGMAEGGRNHPLSHFFESSLGACPGHQLKGLRGCKGLR